MQRFVAVGTLGAIVAVLGGVVAGLGRLLSSSAPSTASGPQLGSSSVPSASPPSTAASTTPGSTKGTRLGPASDVPVGGAASFTDPAQGVPAFVVQPARGQFLAFSAICTHAGCQVQFDSQNDAFICPCHGSTFSAKTGAVLGGPAPSPLASIPIALGPGNELYVDG